MKMTCEKCKWWSIVNAIQISPSVPDDGECRRRAPGPKGWPDTLKTDGCGDYEENEGGDNSTIHNRKS